jgi:hypothetical protein
VPPATPTGSPVDDEGPEVNTPPFQPSQPRNVQPGQDDRPGENGQPGPPGPALAPRPTPMADDEAPEDGEPAAD